MAEFVYSAWFTDVNAHPDDQDREWVVCFVIDASSAKQAQDWGDTLSRDRVARLPKDRFARSTVELKRDVRAVTDWSSVPRIRSGQLASDPEIGW